MYLYGIGKMCRSRSASSLVEAVASRSAVFAAESLPLHLGIFALGDDLRISLGFLTIVASQGLKDYFPLHVVNHAH